MKKSVRKLTLHRETVVRLDALAKVAAGYTTIYTNGDSVFTREPGFTEPGGLTAFPCDVPVVTYPWC